MSESKISAAYANGLAHPLAQLMDRDGMLPAWMFCMRCNKTLNADGNHPAELYLGTFTGLCYGCAAAGPYVARVSLLDGARVLSYPPHCPSWRRDRETYTGYPDCEACQGSGVQGHGTSAGGGRYRLYCRACIERYGSHPVRALDREWRLKLQDAGDRAYRLRMTLAAGLRPSASRKRQEAAWTALGDDVKSALRAEIKPRYKRLLARHEARIERLGGNAWREPTGAELAA